MKEITYVLGIAYKASIALQKKSLTLSDVYAIWVKMTLHLEACVEKPNNETNFASLLLDTVTQRKNETFNNPMMTCALFLDPRFRTQIKRDEHKMEEAKATLLNIWRRLLTLNCQTADVEIAATAAVANTSTKSAESFEYDEEAGLENFLNNSIVTEPMPLREEEEDIEHLIDMFNPEALRASESIIEFWESKKSEHKEIYKLAIVIMGIPPTEVQSERDFSKLDYVFTDRRCKLTEERLEDIMIINLNPEVFYLIKQEEQSETLSNENATMSNV